MWGLSEPFALVKNCKINRLLSKFHPGIKQFDSHIRFLLGEYKLNINSENHLIKGHQRSQKPQKESSDTGQKSFAFPKQNGY